MASELNFNLLIASFSSISYNSKTDSYIMYDSLNQTILSLSPDDRIRILLKKPLKSLRARFLKVGPFTSYLYLLENSKMLKVLTHVNKGDTSSGYNIIKPKGDFITDYCEISKQKFCILTKDGHLNMFGTLDG
jgi:hypothetical protein